MEAFAIKDLPWLSSAVMRGEVISFACIEDLPPEAVREKKAAPRFGPRSNVTLPHKVGGWVGWRHETRSRFDPAPGGGRQP